MPPRSFLTFAAALAILIAAAPGARAQTVTGLGADALTVPEGVVRFRVTPVWTRWRERVGPASLAGGDAGSPISEPLRIERTVFTAALAAEVGLTNWLSLEVTVPFVRSRVESNFNLLLLSPDPTAESPQVTLARSGVGDVEAGARLQLFSTLSRRRRLAPPTGIHIRSAVAAVARLGTGTRDLLGDSIDIGTGDAQSDVEVRSEWDLILGRLWTSAVARYGWQLARQEEIVGATPGRVETVDRDLGDYLEVEVTPRLSLGRYFGIGARYVYRSKAEDRLTTGGPSAPVEVTGVTERVSRVFGGIAYSSVAGFRQRQARVPIDVSLQYGGTLRRPNGARRQLREVVLQARVYTRFFGRGPIR